MEHCFTALMTNGIIIIIIERKDLGGVMSKRLQGHLTTLKTVPKRECYAKWEQSICQMRS